MDERFRQYSDAAERQRANLIRRIYKEYGLSVQEVQKLTGLKLRDNPGQSQAQREELAAAYAEGAVI